MQEIVVYCKTILVLLGAILLSLSLYPIRNVANQLKKGSLRIQWNILSSLIVFFIISYIFYAYQYWVYTGTYSEHEFLIPIILFLGGVLVLLVGKLASQTTKDISKIAILQYQSITDPLMAIKNRRYFDQRIKEEIRIALRYNLPLSLAIIDIDNFKYVNDTYGHLIGDEVLKELAKDINHIARKTDIVARYGGEEIVIITPNTTKEDATVLLERLRSVVEKSNMVVLCSSQEVVKITVSVGIAGFNAQSVSTSEEIIKQADKALYQAKKEGKNRVITCEK